MADLYARIAELRRKNISFCIVTVVETSGMTPRKAGAKAIVFPDGKIEGTVGGGSIELEALGTAKSVIATGKPLLKNYPLEDVKDGMTCGGIMTLYYEPVLPPRRLTIFGGGHVGRAISHVAQAAGWLVRIVDQRQGVLDPTHFPAEAELIGLNYDEYIEKTEFDQNDWLVIVTPKHEYDEQVLNSLVSREYAYLGMMGSEKKVTAVIRNLIASGHSRESLQGVHTPIGLNIGKETPGEIAVAIVSEMLACLNEISEVRSCRISI